MFQRYLINSQMIQEVQYSFFFITCIKITIDISLNTCTHSCCAWKVSSSSGIMLMVRSKRIRENKALDSLDTLTQDPKVCFALKKTKTEFY